MKITTLLLLAILLVSCNSETSNEKYTEVSTNINHYEDGYVGDNRIKMCTGFKDKEKAQKFFLNLIEKAMIKNRLSTTRF